MKSLVKIILTLVILVGAGGAVYHYRDNLPYFKPYIEEVKNYLHPVRPCKDIITYSIGTFDPKFGLSKQQYLDVIAEAGKVWEDAAGKKLFQYSATGTLEMNLIYDYRQEATDQMQKVGISINDDKSTYDTLKERYDSLTNTYEQKKAELQVEIDSYNEKRAAYEKTVQYWNSRGGAPDSRYASLKDQEQELNSEASAVNQDQKELNSIGTDINSTITVLNSVAQKLNMKVNTYNSIGSSTGEEFNEGEYMHDNEGTRINVYQFENSDKLRRVLEHELGHALGLDHVDDPKAIMYRLNTSTNESLTSDDINELTQKCLK